MGRYTLNYLYEDISDFTSDVKSAIANYSSMLMGISATDRNEVVEFLITSVYYYFGRDYVAYEINEPEDVGVFIGRLSYDVAIKLPYWYRKYQYYKTLLTSSDITLLQTSKMTSSSSDTTKSAGGSLQKGATTPTGVSTGTATDNIDITIGSTSQNFITTEGFVDKYTSHQQKYANASKVEGSRSGEILREGSIDELLNVMEKLPSSFANELTKDLQKHFIFDYDGEDMGLYDEQ